MSQTAAQLDRQVGPVAPKIGASPRISAITATAETCRPAAKPWLLDSAGIVGVPLSDNEPGRSRG